MINSNSLPPLVTPGNELHPPSMMRVPRFAVDADVFERLAAKYAVGDEMKNLAFHVVKSKRELDAKLAELMPIQQDVHSARVALEQGRATLEKDRDANRAAWIEATVAIEQRQDELTVKQAELTAREAAVEAVATELMLRERELDKERTDFAVLHKRLEAELAAHEAKAAPVNRQLAALRKWATDLIAETDALATSEATVADSAIVAIE
jgi:chromosome segregation ATPase